MSSQLPFITSDRRSRSARSCAGNRRCLPRSPHRGTRDRERRGYASARMVRSRRLLLGLCLGWQAAACGPSEPGATDKPARPESPSDAEADEPDLRALLRLDERSFPLTVWAAYIIQNEYFDKERLDPRVQLVWRRPILACTRPNLLLVPAGDQATITVGSARQEFSRGGARRPPGGWPIASSPSSASRRPSSSSSRRPPTSSSTWRSTACSRPSTPTRCC